MFIPIVVGKGSNMSDYRHAFHGATSASKAASDRDKEVQNGQFKDLLAAAWPCHVMLQSLATSHPKIHFFCYDVVVVFCMLREEEREREREG